VADLLDGGRCLYELGHFAPPQVPE
jgi:hypothetical protein